MSGFCCGAPITSSTLIDLSIIGFERIGMGNNFCAPRRREIETVPFLFTRNPVNCQQTVHSAYVYELTEYSNKPFEKDGNLRFFPEAIIGRADPNSTELRYSALFPALGGVPTSRDCRGKRS